MFRVFISSRLKKQKDEGTKCHAKTMMSREVDKTVFILIVCLFAASFCPVMILLQPRIQKGESRGMGMSLYNYDAQKTGKGFK